MPIKDGRGLTVFGAAVVHKRVDMMRHLLKNHVGETSREIDVYRNFLLFVHESHVAGLSFPIASL